MNKDSFTHAPSRLREQFQEWLDSYEPDWLREIDIRPVSALLDALAECGDTLPADYCDQLEIPKGSTYAEAVEDVRQWYAQLQSAKAQPPAKPTSDSENDDRVVLKSYRVRILAEVCVDVEVEAKTEEEARAKARAWKIAYGYADARPIERYYLDDQLFFDDGDMSWDIVYVEGHRCVETEELPEEDE